MAGRLTLLFAVTAVLFATPSAAAELKVISAGAESDPVCEAT